jgi:hypothetical protein
MTLIGPELAGEHGHAQQAVKVGEQARGAAALQVDRHDA